MTAMQLSQANEIFQRAVDRAIGERGEVGLQVAACLDGELVADACGGIADQSSGRRVDRSTLFPVFSVVKAVTAVSLHIQAERGLIEILRSADRSILAGVWCQRQRPRHHPRRTEPSFGHPANARGRNAQAYERL